MSGPVRLPPHPPGLRIGLFGGSFNPPHAGHLLVSLIALRRLRLDRVWWLVSPGNPLKDNAGLPSVADRVAAARNVARHPRIVVTGVEQALHARYTADTLRALRLRCPAARFVWIMGADNLVGLHRWRRWREMAAETPFAVVDRPGVTLRGSFAGGRLEGARLPERDAPRLAEASPPAWVLLHDRRSPLSSTALRAAVSQA